MKKQSVLITGAGGFIGSHVVRVFLTKRACRVVALSRNPCPETLSTPDFVWVQGSFLDAEQLNQVFALYSIRAVIHLAALRGAGSGGETDYQTVNVDGTERLLEAALRYRVNTFIFCSSVGVHGTIPVEVPATRMSPFHGDSLYHTSKILAEAKVRQYVQRGLNAYIVRPTITYGAGDTGFPNTLVELVRKRCVLLSSGGNVNIHLLNVGSFAELLWRMLSKEKQEGPRIYIAADAEPIPLKELVDIIHRHYYGSHYPPFLQLPNMVYRGCEMAFRLTHNEKWLTRVLLLSKSWYYEIHETIQHCSYEPANTAETFIAEMQL